MREHLATYGAGERLDPALQYVHLALVLLREQLVERALALLLLAELPGVEGVEGVEAVCRLGVPGPIVQVPDRAGVGSAASEGRRAT